MLKNKLIILLGASFTFGINNLVIPTVHAKDTTFQSIQNYNDYQLALKQINDERKKRGIKPLKFDINLNRIAKKRSAQIVTNFSHFNKQNKFIAAKMLKKSYHIQTLAENISMVQDTSKSNQENITDSINDMFYHDADSNWGHKMNFLMKHANRIGIGINISSNKVINLAFEIAIKK